LKLPDLFSVHGCNLLSLFLCGKQILGFLFLSRLDSFELCLYLAELSLPIIQEINLRLKLSLQLLDSVCTLLNHQALLLFSYLEVIDLQQQLL
jgi:hypothetical protein